MKSSKTFYPFEFSRYGYVECVEDRIYFRNGRSSSFDQNNQLTDIPIEET